MEAGGSEMEWQRIMTIKETDRFRDFSTAYGE